MDAETLPKVPASLRFGRFELDQRRGTVCADGREVALRPKTFALLSYFAAHPGRLISKAELLDAIWSGVVVTDDSLTHCVSELRAALGEPDLVTTVARRGYRLELPMDAAALPAPPTSAPTSPSSTSPPSSAPRTPGIPALPIRRRVLAPGASPLLGRDTDVAALCAALEEERLVTITGPAGVGKTSVAWNAACAVDHRFSHGAVWVDVAALRSAEQIAGMVATEAGVQLGPGDAVAALLRGLGDRELLLVLDNCERLVDEVAQLVARLLRTTAALRVLATSQVPLRVASESLYRLLPLEVPPAGADAITARGAPALALLLRRARAADRQFELSDAMLPWAGAICRRLDGIPLALELAARRLPALGPQALHDMLDQRFALLNRHRVDLPARQLALQAALDWSCSLLSATELQALQCLSSFVAGFRLQSATLALETSPVRAADLVGSLVDKSLVQVEARDPPRYRLLESTRMHAAQGLHESGQEPRVQSRWRAAMAALGSRSDADFWRLSDADWLGLYGDDQTGLEAAFEDCVAAGDVEGAGLVGLALQRLDELRGIGAKASVRKQIALSLALRHDEVRARDAELWTLLSLTASPPPQGLTRMQASERRLAAWRLRADAREICTALGAVAIQRAAGGLSAQALELLGQSEALVRPDWPHRLLSTVASQSAMTRMHLGDAAGYARAAESAADHAVRAQSPLHAWRAGLMCAHALLLAGKPDSAVPQLRQLEQDAREAGHPIGIVVALAFLSMAEVMSSDVPAARRTACQALPLALHHDMAEILREQAVVIAALDGRLGLAAKLLGFARRPAQRYVPVGWLDYSPVLDRAHARLSRAMPAQALADLVEEGNRLEFDAGIALVSHALLEPLAGC